MRNEIARSPPSAKRLGARRAHGRRRRRAVEPPAPAVAVAVLEGGARRACRPADPPRDGAGDAAAEVAAERDPPRGGQGGGTRAPTPGGIRGPRGSPPGTRARCGTRAWRTRASYAPAVVRARARSVRVSIRVIGVEPTRLGGAHAWNPKPASHRAPLPPAVPARQRRRPARNGSEECPENARRMLILNTRGAIVSLGRARSSSAVEMRRERSRTGMVDSGRSPSSEFTPPPRAGCSRSRSCSVAAIGSARSASRRCASRGTLGRGPKFGCRERCRTDSFGREAEPATC